MADYFVADTHLRLDCPDRGLRLASVVDRLEPSDRLFVVGDLCDFWFASRQSHHQGPPSCPGLSALDRFQQRGGTLSILLGNHDAWLGPYYRDRLGWSVVPEPMQVESFGLRVWMAHGHRVRGKSWWKGALEGRAVLEGFRHAPGPLARQLEGMLDRVNSESKAEADARLTALFRIFADTLADQVDLVVFGHVHTIADDQTRTPRLVVLGDWRTRGSYLRIDERGAAPLHCDWSGIPDA